MSDPRLDFLAGAGEMGRRIAVFDWASTPIGPIHEWPSSLRHTVSLMLRSPVPIVLLWGEQGVMIYNDAYSIFAGSRDSRLLGSNVREGWDEISDFNDNVMRVGLAGNTLRYKDHPLTLHRDDRPEQVWMDLDYSPVLGDGGKPAGVIAIVVETTEAVRMRVALEASERRLRFLDKLGRAMADLGSADEILAHTVRMTAQHLGLSNCAYAAMDADGNGFTIRGNWHEEAASSIAGHYRLSDLGETAVDALHAGRPLVIGDTAADLPPEEARRYRDLGVSAIVCMPLLKEGRLTALMTIHDKVPHAWSDDELSVIREVTDWSWAHVQRVGAEGTLREREAHHRQILDSAIDYGIVATDRDGRVTLWNCGAQAMLGWSEAEMLGQPMEVFFTPEDRALGRPQAKRQEALETGRAHDARWHLRKSGERFWGLSEMTPLRNEDGAEIGFVKLIRDRTEEHQADQALRMVEDQLHRAQAAGGVGLFSIDFMNNVVSGSQEFCRIFGFDPCNEIAIEVLEALVVAEDLGIFRAGARRRAGTAKLDVEYRIHRANDGELRTIARKAEYELDAAGTPIRMVGVVQDITERQRIQVALEMSEAQFSTLAQNMPNQVWTAGADGRLDWFNDQVYAYSGVARGTVDEQSLIAVVHPEDLPAVARRWLASLSTGRTFETELRLRDAEGIYRWHLARALPLRDRGGAITAWVGTSTEIEAQKQAEAAFAQDRDRLWTISQDLMLVSDFSGVITAVNPSSHRILGWSEADMAGRPIADFLHPDDLAATTSEIAKLSAGETTFAFENRYRTWDGQYRLLAWTAVPDGGRIHGIGRDITEQRSVEDALRQSQKMEAVGQLTGGIAHDFNNLLQGISGSLDMLETRVEKGRINDLTRWIVGAKSSAARAAALTHRLLAFSRRQPLDPRPVRSNPLIVAMEDMLRRPLGETIELELILPDELWLTRCDPNQLESAILNLVINARDAMPHGGKIRIETRNYHLTGANVLLERDVKPGQYVCVTVSDDGVGMSKETIARAFEPFFTTKPIGLGTGLGLSMIYGFTRQSGGFARIDSVPGRGSSISIYLPRHRGGDQLELKAPGVKQVPGSDAGEIVLVVEDEPVVRGPIIEVLNELGYAAIEADDGPSGLEILQSGQRIDLLITDIGLPGLNGRQVADAAQIHRPALKVLFMTGYAETAALASGFLKPGMAMITKPFAMDVLARRIREIIEGP